MADTPTTQNNAQTGESQPDWLKALTPFAGATTDSLGGIASIINAVNGTTPPAPPVTQTIVAGGSAGGSQPQSKSWIPWVVGGIVVVGVVITVVVILVTKKK